MQPAGSKTKTKFYERFCLQHKALRDGSMQHLARRGQKLAEVITDLLGKSKLIFSSKLHSDQRETCATYAVPQLAQCTITHQLPKTSKAHGNPNLISEAFL